MLNYDEILYGLGLVVVLAPALLFAILGVSCLLLNRGISERVVTRSVQTSIIVGLLAASIILVLMLTTSKHHVPIPLGTWVVIPNYHFVLKFEFDRLSVPFVILTFVLCGTIGSFAFQYMHREPGYNRFFVLYALFLMGMTVTSLSGTIETLFAGWEMVGLSSALLVAFYHERPAPVRNGLRVWTVYRVSDAALLIASIVLHHLTHEGDFDRLFGNGNWPDGPAKIIGPDQVLPLGLLLLLAAAGKSALVPFSGWLPRAMEGPTPSSAVFYGALSVHLGAFLLLRVSPMLSLSPLLCVAIIVLGVITAIFSMIAGNAQTDIKSALCFASLTQVSIIVAEIGCGLRYIPLIHILGHACFRTLQFVRAPSLLHDRRILENAIGDRLPRVQRFWERRLSDRTRTWLYRIALERGYLDYSLDKFFVNPTLRLFRWCDGLERRWTDLLTGGKSRESDRSDFANRP
jgi:NADH-quinone oxidoreductase subunit L